MPESLPPRAATKEETYRQLMPSLEALVRGEPDLHANLGNLAAALHEAMGFLWIGFYKVVPARSAGADHELLLGPFQGPVACTRIGFGQGVCGACWQRKEAIVVPDVNAFPGHIACSARSRSEIVVPVFRNGEVAMVLDVDSERPAAFDDTDREYLHRVAGLVEKML
jgi:L-methionine (R)-S-oxide reductase